MVMLLARNGLNGLVYHPILKYRIVLLNNINNIKYICISLYRKKVGGGDMFFSKEESYKLGYLGNRHTNNPLVLYIVVTMTIL